MTRQVPNLWGHMIIEKFLEQEHRESVETGDATQRGPGRISAALFPREIAAHRAFALSLAIWCAAAAGGSVMVLGQSALNRLAALTGASGSGASLQTTYAAIAAVCAAILGLIIGRLIQRRAARASFDPAHASMAARTVHAIDPKADLGVDSLDAPLEEAPFALDSDQPESEPEFAAQTCDAPREMDLEDFGKLPGRDAVWVHDPAPNIESAAKGKDTPIVSEAEAPEPAQFADPEPIASARMTALEKLRAVPPKDLSLVQMIERFAAALQDHQDKVEALSSDEPQPAETAAREAALVEALKALSAYSHRGFQDPNIGQRGLQAVKLVSETEEELRGALAKLKTLRGAA